VVKEILEVQVTVKMEAKVGVKIVIINRKESSYHWQKFNVNKSKQSLIVRN
jgi:hypothetical protein